MESKEMRENIARIREEIKSIGREDDLLLVAATKMVEAERINESRQYGITDIGENRVQELIGKYEQVEGMNWHFIGKLQKNKVKYIIDKVSLIHSVDSLSLATEISRQAEKQKRIMNILLEVNIGGEETKGGITADKLSQLAEEVMELPYVRIRGLMSVLPINADEKMYEQMNNLYTFCQKQYNSLRLRLNTARDYALNVDDNSSNSPSFEFLSVGMSGDYKLALKHNSNIIRIGSAIFGNRNYQNK